jgi:hypothetical protein
VNDQAFISSLESAVPTSDPLAEARTLVAGLAVRVNADKKAAFAPDVIAALKLLKEESRGDYEEALDILKACQVKVQSVASEVAKVEKLRLVQPGEQAAKLVCDFPGLRDAPITDLIVPSGYSLAPDLTTRHELFAQEDVAYGCALITGRTKDVDTGAEGMRLSWTRGNGWRHRVVDRRAIANSRLLVELAEFGFPITSTTAKEMVDYLAKLESQNLPSLHLAQTVAHLGWQTAVNTTDFLLGREIAKDE